MLFGIESVVESIKRGEKSLHVTEIFSHSSFFVIEIVVATPPALLDWRFEGAIPAPVLRHLLNGSRRNR